MKKNKLLVGLVSMTLLGSFLFSSPKAGTKVSYADEEQPQFAEPGMVAYAASYSSDITNEPKYTTQNSTTFQYLNLGSTLNTYRGDSVKVGIIDSGINYDHEDFMVSGSTKVKGDSKYYDYQSSSWVYYKASQHGYSYIDDSLGHGTNVAATVAAAVNSVGGLGLAPNVELYVYKVTNSNNGYEFGAIQNALMNAKTLGLNIINMSFQSYEHAVSYNSSSMAASSGCSTILSSYINDAYNAGITLVAAAGNYNTSEPSYPGSNSKVINVGSLNNTGTGKAPFSNYGSTIDLVAPGYVHVADEASNTAYTNTQGTSFSAPLVTAAIALYKQKNPSATPAQIESALYASCDPIDSGSTYSNWAGHGSLNVAKFLGTQENSPTVSSVTVNPSALSLDLNGTKTGNLSATVNGTNNPDQTVTWESSNSSVATVSSTGTVTAKATGTATITATSTVDTTKSGTCSVTVLDSTVHVAGVSLNKNSTTISVGSTETLTATVTPNNATNKSVTWSSNNTSVANVNSSGVVTAVATGSATITVTTTDGGLTYTCTVTVQAAQSQTLIITRSSFSGSGNYAWYNWTQTTSDSTSISGKGELYAITTASMQFNKGNGSKSGAIFNTDAIPGSITKIEAQTASGTNRTWNAFVTSTACSLSGTSLTFGANKTTVGSNITVGTSLTSLGTSNAGYSYFCIQENVNSASYISQFKITYTPKSISTISVKTAPTKTTYEAGECFDPSGLVITATYSDSTTSDISYASASSQFSFIPTTSTPLTTDHTSVTITYGGKSTSQAITVSAAKTLSSISVSGQTTSFVEGDTFIFGGTVTAHYSDSSSADVTSSATFSGYNMTAIGNQTVTVSYTYKNTSKTQTYSINIGQGTLSSIAVSGQTTVYMKNNAFSFDGTCIATFTNGYQKNVTPTNVTSPDMSTSGQKTVTVSFTYNGVTENTSYTITVNSNRVVIETQTSTDYSILGTITYPSNVQTITPETSTSGLSVSRSGSTTIENDYVRCGSGKTTGTITINSSSANITKVVASMWSYGSDGTFSITFCGSNQQINGTETSYTKEYSSPVSSFSIASQQSSKRVNISIITVYTTVEIEEEVDISSTPDCQGLEQFIDENMHMDYVENLGYCSDSKHHYYSTAKSAFNSLNTHQRTLFTTNSAYVTEWTRLSTWASINGDSLNGSNQLASSKTQSLINSIQANNAEVIIIVVASIITLSAVGGYFFIRRRKEQ